MNKKNQKEVQEFMPCAEEVAQELGKATSIDDFYGKDGIFAKLFSKAGKIVPWRQHMQWFIWMHSISSSKGMVKSPL